MTITWPVLFLGFAVVIIGLFLAKSAWRILIFFLKLALFALFLLLVFKVVILKNGGG